MLFYGSNPVVSRVEDMFIGHAERDIDQHVPRSVFYDNHHRARWQNLNGNSVLLKNNIGSHEVPAFYCEASVGVAARAIQTALSDVYIEAQGSCAATGKFSILFRCTDNNNFWHVWFDAGVGLLRLQKKAAGVTTTINTISLNLSADTRYQLSVEATGTSIKCWLNDAHLISTTDSFNQTAKMHGIRMNIGARCYEFICREYIAWDRTYFSQSGDDSTGNGTIATPYKTLSKLESEALLSSGNHRFLLKSGERWRESNQFDNVEGSGTGWDDSQPIIIGRYDVGDKPRVTPALDKSSGWSGPDANGEYTLTGQSQTLMFLLEDGVRMNGATKSMNSRFHPLGSAYSGHNRCPVIGSLNPGDWYLDEGPDVLYYKPTSGAPSSHLIEISTGSAAAIRVSKCNHIIVQDLHAYASGHSSGPMNAHGGSSDFVWFRRNEVHTGIRGMVVGSLSTIVTDWRMSENDIHDQVWRGAGSTSPNPSNGCPRGQVAFNYIHDNFRLKADYGDMEIWMIGPADDNVTLEWNHCYQNGPTDDIPVAIGQCHVGCAHDDPSELIVRYNWIEGSTMGAFHHQSDEGNCTGEFYYNVIVACGTDKGPHNRKSGLSCRAGEGYTLNIKMHHNLIVDCEFSNGHDSNGCFNFWINSSGGTINADVYNNVIASFHGNGWYFKEWVNGGTLNLSLDGLLMHRSDANTNAVKLVRYTGNSSYSTSQLLGGAGTWQGDESLGSNMWHEDPTLKDVTNRDFRACSGSVIIDAAIRLTRPYQNHDIFAQKIANGKENLGAIEETTTCP